MLEAREVKISGRVSLKYQDTFIGFVVDDKLVIGIDLEGEKNRNALIDKSIHTIIHDHGRYMGQIGISAPIDTVKLAQELHAMSRELKDIRQKIIIPVGGSGERWGNFLGVKKQDIKIDGETLVNRIVRQVLYAGFDDIYMSKERPVGDASKYMGSVKEWNKEGRTLFLLGDVYYTDKAMHKILFDDDRNWRMFGRAMPNHRKDHPEPFALSFYPEHHQQIRDCATRVMALFGKGKTDGAGFLFLYRALVGLPDELMGAHLYGENWTDINDLTDDFDNPNDYHSFMEEVR